MRTVKRGLLGAGLLGSLLLSSAGTAQAAATWHEVRLPFLWPLAYVNDLAATAPDNVWMAGTQGWFCVPAPVGCYASSPGNAVVRRWNGSAWLEYPLNGVQGGTGGASQVEVSGSEVWIAGPQSQVRRFNGSAFEQVAIPGGADAVRLSVNPSGVWLGLTTWSPTTTTQYRRTGSGWTATPPPAGVDTIDGVTARTSDEAWAHDQESLLRWNGSTWSTAASLPPVPDGYLVADLKATGPGEVWASFVNYVNGPNPARVFRYKSGEWTEKTPALASSSWSFGIDGRGALWAVPTGGTNTMVEYDGSAWQERPVPSGVYFSDLTGVPGTGTLWAIARKDLGGPYVFSNF